MGKFFPVLLRLTLDTLAGRRWVDRRWDIPRGAAALLTGSRSVLAQSASPDLLPQLDDGLPLRRIDRLEKWLVLRNSVGLVKPSAAKASGLARPKLLALLA